MAAMDERGSSGSDVGGEAGDDVAVAIDEELLEVPEDPGSGLVVAPCCLPRKPSRLSRKRRGRRPCGSGWAAMSAL